MQGRKSLPDFGDHFCGARLMVRLGVLAGLLEQPPVLLVGFAPTCALHLDPIARIARAVRRVDALGHDGRCVAMRRFLVRGARTTPQLVEGPQTQFVRCRGRGVKPAEIGECHRRVTIGALWMEKLPRNLIAQLHPARLARLANTARPALPHSRKRLPASPDQRLRGGLDFLSTSRLPHSLKAHAAKLFLVHLHDRRDRRRHGRKITDEGINEGRKSHAEKRPEVVAQAKRLYRASPL